MNKILFNFKNFYFVLLLLVFSGNMHAQCTVTGSVNTSTMPCSSYTGCTSVNIGNGSTATTLNFNANLDLTCLGAIQFVIKNNASVNFGSSDRLYLGAGSSIIVEAGGDISGSSCNASERIYIGGVLYASCNGGGGAVATFSDIETFGGSGSITTNSPVCVGNSINLSATPPPNGGPFTYTWYEPSVSTSTSIGTGQSISIASATSGSHIYQVKMYSASLNKTMIAIATVVVSSASAPAAPTITAGGPTTFCSGGSVTLTSSAGTSYLWSTGATTQSISATTSGSYTVQVTNAGGCQSNSSATTTVTVRSLVNNIGTGFSSSTFCSGEQATMTFDANNGSGVYPYTLVYKNNTTNALTSVTIPNDDPTTFNIIPNPTVTTNYTLISITDANGCIRTNSFGDDSAEATINSAPNVPAIGTVTQTTCLVSTGSVIINDLPSSGTWTLTQSGTATNTITGTGTTTTVSGLATGTYTFTVSKGACTSAVSTSVTINPQPGIPNKPIITSYSLPTFANNDGSVTLGDLPSGAWVLSIIVNDGAPIYQNGSGTSVTLSGLSVGKYEFEVSQGCTSARSNAQILVYYSPTVNPATANCNGFVASWPVVPTATNYLLDVSTVSDFSSFVGVYHDFDVGNVSSYSLTGLQTGSTLYYRFRAMNSTKITLYSNTITVSPLVTNTYSGAWDNGTPTSNQNLVFNSEFSSTGNIEGCNCTVTNNGNVVINSPHTLKIINSVRVNGGGSLTFEDSASLVQINDVANTGNISYKRYANIRNTDYTYWSSPVAGYTLGGVSQNLTLSDKYYSYNSSLNDWQQESASTGMTAGIGYIIRGPEAATPTPLPTPPSIYEASFVGVPNNGNVFVPVTFTNPLNLLPTDANYGVSYLLGNPYPSAIDAETFLDINAGVLGGTIYFWTHNTALDLAANITNPDPNWAYAYSLDDYAAYNSVGGVGVGSGSPANSGGLPPNGKIAAGQGFFATSIATGTVTFNNTMRLEGTTLADGTGTNQQFFKTKNPKAKTTTIEKHRIWLNLTNTQGAFKQTLLGYVANATNEYDSRFDGESFDGQEYVDFYSINKDKNLTIQGRTLPFDENDEVPLGFRSTIGGLFSISIDKVDGLLTNQNVFLEDKLTKTTVNLKEENYTFATAAGTFDDRFVLKYVDKTLSIEEIESNDGIIALYSKNYKTLIIRNNLKGTTVNSVKLFNLAGQKIANWEVNGREQTSIQIPIKNLPSEIYIVKIETTQGEFSKKIIMN